MTTLLMTGCAFGSVSPSNEVRPTDICTSGIEPFAFSELVLDLLPRTTKENALLVNCTLYEKCGFKVPNEEVCKNL